MSLNRIVIIGFGGLARELKWLIGDVAKHDESIKLKCVGHVISDASGSSGEPSKTDLLGNFNWLQENRDQWDSLVIGIGTPKIRDELFKKLCASFPDANWPTLIHPSAHLDLSSAQLGRGTILCANVIGTVHLKIAENCLINLSCTIGHEAEIGTGSVINPSVNISGGVQIGKRVLLGTGAQVLQYLQVKDDATIGAGSVVTKNVAEGITVVGAPAKVLARQ